MALAMRLTFPVAAALFAYSAVPVATQPAPPSAKPEMMLENCPGLISSRKPRVIPAALAGDQIRISYVGHATFLIESPRLVRMATDYNNYVRPPMLPDIVTMNHAHSTHFTDSPEPGIKHVLRGWGPSPEQPARHDLHYQDVRVRNVPTNIRSWGGGTERHGNSIFIFEIANMCVAHLGHLHHTLTQTQLNEIGRIDAVMFPVDGGVTLDREGMIDVLAALKAPVMIPMHSFSAISLNGFVQRAKEREGWSFEVADVPSVVLSKATLPAAPKFLVLPGR